MRKGGYVGFKSIWTDAVMRRAALNFLWLVAAALLLSQCSKKPDTTQTETAPTDSSAADPVNDIKFVGSTACIGCHESQAESWQPSHHGKAWTQADSDNVLGDFNGATYKHGDETFEFSQNNGAYFVKTQLKGAAPKKYRIHSVAGIAPLQQYLIETEGGRLQAFDTAWDVQAKRWYPLYPDQMLKATDGLHWTGPYKNWNSRCAVCHSTDYKKNYNPEQNIYTSTQSEIGVGCEACHGPGAAHLEWANESKDGKNNGYKPASGLSSTGLALSFAADNPQLEIQQCASCHSRREPLIAQSPPPGTHFGDSYKLALLRQGLYHADGTIEDEVYVYGSFLQSKMYQNGVRCTDCHDPHTAAVKIEGNMLCAQCHSPAGNERFASLRKADYDTPDHHFHKQGSEGAQCKSCHMVERVYMGIDGRRDHSFRVPRPDLSVKLGTPNSCNDCHSDKSAAWAAKSTQAHFPNSTKRGPHFAEVFAPARENPAAQIENLMAIANDTAQAGIVRATALDLLRSEASEDLAMRAEALLSDEDDLVRAAAILLQRGTTPETRAQRIGPLLKDPIKNVRITAAQELSGGLGNAIHVGTVRALDTVNKEWGASLSARSDYPEAHMQLAGFFLSARKLPEAQAEFAKATAQDPQLVQAWEMQIRITAALSEIDEAKAIVKQALEYNPGNALLIDYQKQLDAMPEPEKAPQ